MSKVIYKGKVRDIYEVNDDYLLMKATDRISAFDRNIGDLSGKGELLNKMSEFWFKNTRHIIDNHLLVLIENSLLLKNANLLRLK